MPKYFVSVVGFGTYETEVDAKDADEAVDAAIAEAYADGDPGWEAEDVELIADAEEED